jgi:hypothetical protein
VISNAATDAANVVGLATQRPVAELAFSEPSGRPAWKSSPAWALEAAADCDNLWSPRTTSALPAARASHPRRCGPGHPARLRRPPRLALNHWALAGNWTVGRQAIMANQAGGRILYRFHARDLHLVMAPPTPETPARFQVLVDSQPPGPAHGTDLDDQGNGTLTHPRLYQLLRQPGPISDHTLELSFLDPGVQAYAFTFG